MAEALTSASRQPYDPTNHTNNNNIRSVERTKDDTESALNELENTLNEEEAVKKKDEHAYFSLTPNPTNSGSRQPSITRSSHGADHAELQHR